MVFLFCRLPLVARWLDALAPQVVGQIVAGVLMGPSLFGLFLAEGRKNDFHLNRSRSVLPVSEGMSRPTCCTTVISDMIGPLHEPAP